MNISLLTEEEYYDSISKEVLDEGVFSAITKGAATILGYTSLTVFAGLGAALVAKSAVSKEGKIRKFFKRIFKTDGKFKYDDFSNKPAARREIAYQSQWKNRIPEVFDAISRKDWNRAEETFKKSKYTENDDAVKAIAIAITEEIGEPPLYVYPQGNQTYFKCKQILGIKYAKALTQSVIAALKQNKSYYDNISLSNNDEEDGNK